MSDELRTKIADICEWAAEIYGSAFDPSRWTGAPHTPYSWIDWVEDHKHELNVPLSVRKAEANAWVTDFSNWFDNHISRYSQQYPDCTFNGIFDRKYFISDGNGECFSDRNRPQAVAEVDKRRAIVDDIRSTAWGIKLYHQNREVPDVSQGLSRYTAEEGRIADVIVTLTTYAQTYFEAMSNELSRLNRHKEGPWKSTSAAKIECEAHRLLSHVAQAMDDYYDQIARLETQQSIARQAIKKANEARKVDHTFSVLLILARHREYRALKNFHRSKSRPYSQA